MSRSTSEKRRRSSGFWPKPSPSKRPSTRMNSSGSTSRTRAAMRSRNSRRISFSASRRMMDMGGSFGLVRAATVRERGEDRSLTVAARQPSLVAQRLAGQVQEDALQVGLLGLEVQGLDAGVDQDRPQPQQRALDVAAGQPH